MNYGLGWRRHSGPCHRRVKPRARTGMRSRDGGPSFAMTEDSMLEIDNSAAERALRAVALGRKNPHDRQHCQARSIALRHDSSFVTGKAREHIRRLLKLSFGRWIAQGNDSSEGCLYLPAEIVCTTPSSCSRVPSQTELLCFAS
jgi:hypothetical protein